MSTPANQVPLDPILSQEPPPTPALTTPDALGLDLFRPHMSPNGFDTFITLMHFMIHLQQIVEGKVGEWGDDKMAIAAAPFVGFGNPVMWENAYRHPMRERILPLVLRWNRKGKAWQLANPLPGLFIEYNACDFAQTERGALAANAIEDLIQDPQFREQWRLPAQ